MRGAIWFTMGLGGALAVASILVIPTRPRAAAPPAPLPVVPPPLHAEAPAGGPLLGPAPVAPGSELDGGGPAAAGLPIARHVIIVSEDGLRPDALVQAHAPVHTSVMNRGSWSLEARTIRKASTLPSHAAMLSGFDVQQHGLTWNSWKPDRGYIQVPTVFDAVIGSGQGSAAFVGKWKLQHIAHPGTVDVFSRPGYLCKKVAAEAASYFTKNKPQLEFVHFSDPDEEGHSVGWMSDAQMGAIRDTDKCLATLLRAVVDAGAESDTLFILSADHGGHGRGHSGSRSVDRKIPWIVWGAGVRRGHRIAAPISTVDTAATALWALGYHNPAGALGHVVSEAFR